LSAFQNVHHKGSKNFDLCKHIKKKNQIQQEPKGVTPTEDCLVTSHSTTLIVVRCSPTQQTNFSLAASFWKIYLLSAFILLRRLQLASISIYHTLLSPAKTTFHAELCNPTTRQALELESCSNPLRIQQVLQRKSKKRFFVFGGGFRGGHHKWGCFWLPLPGPGPQPIGPLLWLKIFSET